MTMGERLTPRQVSRALRYHQENLLRLKRVDGRFRTREESRMKKKLRRVWKRQIAWIIESMKDLSQFEQAEESAVRFLEKKRFQPEIDALIQEMPYNEDVVEAIEVSARASFVKGGRKTYKQFGLAGLGISFEVVNEGAVEYLRSLSTLHLSDGRGSITRTTKKRIIKILSDAAEQGTSYQEVAKLIEAQGKAGVFSRARSELIAVREIGLAYGEGNLTPVRRYNEEYGAIIQKLWITSGDDLVTPECQQNGDMGWIELDEHFINTGAQVVAPRSDHPRCRCDTGYREVDTQGNPI